MNKTSKKNLFLRFIKVLENLSNSIKELGRTNKTIAIILGILIIFLTLIEVIHKIKEYDLLPKSEKTIEFSTNAEKTLKILVLPFKNYDNSNFKVEEVITDKLREKAEKYKLDLEVLYDSLSIPVTTFEDAEKIAKSKKSNVDIVIFGELESKNFRTNILNLTVNKNDNFLYSELYQKEITGKYKTNANARKIKNLSYLNDEETIIYILLFNTAIKNKECEKANVIIDKIINLINKSNKNELIDEIEYLGLDLALCYQLNNDIDNALKIAEWNLNNFPNSYETRMIKVGIMMNKLYLVNDKKGILNEIHRELNILKESEESDLLTIPYLYSSFLYFVDNNFKEGIKDLEQASIIEKRESIIPLSKIATNFLKGDFKENKLLFDSIQKDENIESKSAQKIFYLINDFFDGNIENTIEDLTYIRSHKFNLKEDSESIDFLLSFRDVMIEQMGEDIDSIYKALHKNFSKKADENLRNAGFLLILMKNQNDLEYVIKHLKKSIQNNPDYAEYFNFNNLSKDSVIEIKKDISKWKDSISKEPNNYKALSFLSNDYNKLGYSFISRYYSVKAISNDLNSLLYIDNYRLSTKEKNKLRKIFQHYDSIKNSDSNINNAIAYQKIAMVLKKFRIIDYSRDYYHKAISTNPEYINSYSGIGWLEMEEKNYDTALKYFKKEYALKPDSFDANYNVYCSYHYLKQYDSAYYYLNKCINKYTPEIKYVSQKKLNDLKKFIENELQKNNT